MKNNKKKRVGRAFGDADAAAHRSRRAVTEPGQPTNCVVVYACMCVYIYIYIYVYMHMYVCMYVCVYIYTYISCIHMYIGIVDS